MNENFTAYGDRRNPTTWSGSASGDDLSVSAGVTRQGYTWQTALGNMGLNHMNGRVQDAITGVFLSPDPYITEPGNPQNYNRYGYVYNNPMSHTDPSGFSACSADLCDGFYFPGGTGSGLWGSNNGYSIDGGADVSVCYSYSCQKTQTGKSDYYWMQFDAYADKNTNQIVKVTSRLITYHYLPNSILQSSNRSILEQAVGTATTSSSIGSVEARNTSLAPQTPLCDTDRASSSFVEPSFMGFLKEEGLNVLSRTADVVGGAGIVLGGGAACVTVAGCAAGAPLMALGASNIQEGWTGKNGFVRSAATSTFGETAGNATTNVLNIGTSVTGLFKATVHPDSWKLFRNISTDFVPAYKTMTKTGLSVEVGGTALGAASATCRYVGK